MPRANLVASTTAVPLTVTLMAEKLGVSASTLRTWERRYGLGPSERLTGTHRRYLPADVARLMRMVELIHAGVTTADAAAIAKTADSSWAQGSGSDSSPVTSQDLVEAAHEAAHSGEADHLHALLVRSVMAEGLTRTWSDLIQPAIDMLLASPEGEDPGNAPSAIMTVEVLSVLRTIASQRPATSETSPEIVIMTDQEHTLAAHIVGEALEWHHVRVAVISSGCYQNMNGIERYRRHCEKHPPWVVIVMGQGAACEKLVGTLASSHGSDVVIVGEDSPTYLDIHVQRVRTLTACVDETVALIKEKASKAS